MNWAEIKALHERCDRLGWTRPSPEALVVVSLPVGAERTSCDWTMKEDYDVLDALTAGVRIEDVAHRHRRTVRGISLRLSRGLIEHGAELYMETR